MRPVLHIGPTKTASKSIQQIIPLLGRPHLIKLPLMKAVMKEPNIKLVGDPTTIPDGLILSEEMLGDFTVLPPRIISNRLLKLFGPSIVVWVHRQSNERLRSYYRQALKNGNKHVSLEAFDEKQRSKYSRGLGHYMTQDLDALRTAFAPHEFRVIQFDLLKADPQKFLEAFCAACDAPVPQADIPHLNKTSYEG